MNRAAGKHILANLKKININLIVRSIWNIFPALSYTLTNQGSSKPATPVFCKVKLLFCQWSMVALR